MGVLTPKFFEKSPLMVAPKLLGMELWTEIRGFKTGGRITEVEAYCAADDPASHAYKGKTKCNEAMFLAGGHCYVYLIYGMHYCVNVVTEKEDSGTAVLIRALEPIEGIEVMKRRRKINDIRNLTNGPGKLCEALGIDRKFNNENLLTSKKIWLEPGKSLRKNRIMTSPRIGITKAVENPWRFFDRDAMHL